MPAGRPPIIPDEQPAAMPEPGRLCGRDAFWCWQLNEPMLVSSLDSWRTMACSCCNWRDSASATREAFLGGAGHHTYLGRLTKRGLGYRPYGVRLSDLTCLVDVARELGITRQAVQLWQRRYSDFPRPLVVLAVGPIFSREAIDAWLRSTGRL